MNFGDGLPNVDESLQNKKKMAKDRMNEKGKNSIFNQIRKSLTDDLLQSD